jgi:hypothetical protein
MSSNFELFKKQLDEAVELIDESVLMDDINYPLILGEALDTQSLLARCDTISQKHEPKKPIIRVIHHLACSGGSLISKCFSAMPNVFLLSEVHPHSYRHLPTDKAEFLPSDIATLAKQAGFPDSDILAKEIFRGAINNAYNHLAKRGGFLLLRDHSHSDICVGDSITTQSTVIETLSQDFDIKSLITLRNPIDAYASLKNNWWLHFQPDDFDSYCGRVITFLAQFESPEIRFYEDFVSDPQASLSEMCEVLDLPYSDDFELIFDMFNVTGDSGRKGEIIELRERREIDDNLIQEIKSSLNFKYLCEQYRLEYSYY